MYAFCLFKDINSIIIRKINFCYSNRIYILEDAESIHESGMNDLNKWTNIGSCSNWNSAAIASISVLYKEDKVYFICNRYNPELFEFDCKTKQLRKKHEIQDKCIMF